MPGDPDLYPAVRRSGARGVVSRQGARDEEDEVTNAAADHGRRCGKAEVARVQKR